MAYGRYKWVPFVIANGAAKSKPIDLGPTGILVGVSIHGIWTAAKVSFEAYVPDSGVITATGIDNAYTDPAASYDPVKDLAGSQISIGNGTDTTAQFLMLTAGDVVSGIRFIKVISGTSGTTVNQGQAVNG